MEPSHGQPERRDPHENDERWMAEALREARRAMDLGEVPVGAVIVLGDRRIASGYNRREIDGDPLAHAELMAIRRAAREMGGWRLVGCTMYVTLEPCAMCAGALVNSRIERLVFAASDPKGGFCGTLGNLVRDPRLNHQIEVKRGVEQEASQKLLKSFFADLRSQRRQEREG